MRFRQPQTQLAYFIDHQQYQARCQAIFSFASALIPESLHHSRAFWRRWIGMMNVSGRAKFLFRNALPLVRLFFFSDHFKAHIIPMSTGEIFWQVALALILPNPNLFLAVVLFWQGSTPRV